MSALQKTLQRLGRSSVWKSIRNIGFVFANLLLITGGAMVLPIVCSLIYGEKTWYHC